MTRISFIMPTFNRCDLIGESLRAILAQAGANDEILVVDDGSTDTTPSVVATMAPRVRYVRQDNAGKSAALNRGLAMTGGEFVWICDDDDLLRPCAVPRLTSALEASGADFVFGRHERFWVNAGGNRQSMGAGYWPDLASGSLARHMLEDAFFLQNGMLARRACYERVGRFNESFLRSQDYEMLVRMALGCVGAFVDTVVFDQRQHDGPRGPLAARHAPGRSPDVWLHYDRQIFEVNAPILSLSKFEAMFESGDAALLRRAAHLQRACVHVRHGVWAAALADIRSAAAIASDRGLGGVERAICNRMLGSKYGLQGAGDMGFRDDLRHLLQESQAGAQIVRAILAGLLWRIRRDKAAVRRDALLLIAAVAGPLGTPQILVEHLAPGHGRSHDAARNNFSLTERRMTWVHATPV